MRLIHAFEATRRHGMREEDTLKLIRSLVVSRVTYSLPYQRLTKSEQGQVDAMLRKAYKAALKLPPGTPSSKLLALGLSNTFEELCEAQLATQLQRLKQTPTGRDLLLRLGYISEFQDAARRKPIPDQLRATYKVAPIPRNMDPRLHRGRREARVEALERTYAHKNTTYYVDAANYDYANNKAVATVVDHTLTERTSASVRCRNITDAEETAIALALALGYRQRRYRHVKKSDLDSATETAIYLSLLQFQAVIKFVLGGVVSLQLASLRQQLRRRKDAR
ncbi:hypothetical protein MRX96_011865 [Rhipicephalus microplus]